METPSLFQSLEEVTTARMTGANRAAALEAIPLSLFDQASCQAEPPLKECNLLVDLLESGNDALTAIAANRLTTLLANAPFSAVYEIFSEPLINALTSASTEPVLQLVLRQCEKCLKSREQIDAFLATPLLFGLIQALEDGSSQLCEDISAFVAALITELPDQINLILSSHVLSQLHQMALIDDTVQQFRVYDAAARIALSSPSAFDMLVLQECIMDELITQFSQMRDPLSAMLAVEIFSELTLSEKGLRFLIDQGVLAETVLILRDRGEDQPGRLCLPKLLQFIARIAMLHDISFIEEKYAVLPAIFSLYHHSTEMEHKTLILAIIGHLGAHPANLPLFLQSSLSDLLEQVLNNASAVGKERVAAVEALATILNSSRTMGADTDGLVYEVWRRVDQDLDQSHASGASLLRKLIAGTKQAFPDLLIPSYSSIHGLAQRTWGRNAMAMDEAPPGEASCIEYLLDRKQGSEGEGPHWKLAILQAIDHNPLSAESFSPSILERVARYVREGAYYVPTEAAVLVATE
ncbi:26S proteasome non-ATPase regulatory subunit 5 [Piptocephalis cylindrospora]|uniref:26S proteasome non-ATPase regulatory subunit 5 n=1 Tax=Piptocephalis cylindrospora TaxID=1907219 RepID=A0A4P9Y7H6_9FUNG|nr:26S proteasome non-ATPase regulatory subunit 5 [Piptocephalis cylindrospora]|eukprot:RKP14993.1 26S proteasome non-ATPase regulatory subunit 5 [Piptocephalis cylindrospora]